MKYAHVMALAAETPWAITIEKLGAIQRFLATKAAGDDIDPGELAEILTERAAVDELHAAARANPRASGAVAVLPIVGTISQRATMFSDLSGGVSTEQIAKRMRSLVNDPGVKAIILDVDSPGGTVSGVDELASEIYGMRGAKPIVAVSNGMMCSAAYYIGSAADEVVSSPSSVTGSIGVYAMHQDVSKLYELMGVKTTLVSAGKFKVEGNPFEPLTPEGRDALQGRVDAFYDQFVGAVARNRGTTPGTVRDGYGQGRSLTAKDAKAAGMVDRIATLDETIQRFGGSGANGSGANAEDEAPTIAAGVAARAREKARLELAR